MIVADPSYVGQIIDVLAPGVSKDVEDTLKTLRVMSVNLDRNVEEATPYVKVGMAVLTVGVAVITIMALHHYMGGR